MAGHSHWANIKHKKAANDARKAKVITQMGRLIKGAIQVGGPDVDMNPRLRLAIQKAKAQNMTNDAIDRIIAKAKGQAGGAAMEELVYEGYGAGGVAVVVESMTDNRNRTAPEIRKLFERGGGSMGAPGCVAWQFHDKAVFVVADSTEDAVLEALLLADCDAEDITPDDDGSVEIVAQSDQYEAIATALGKAGLSIDRSDLTKIPDNDVEVTDLEVAERIQRLLDHLEDHEDVTGVHTNFAPSPEIAEQL
ncbi:MAG: YebC/PmpR family DNA-binding transcriptional regulator [Planctomycetota bacterium]|jgi:YebC/PmpR family DNA-binding regulatory protein|nr:YebC/PmpR family DNA-binding transcriptional regulator [Planctomycetota bacterium]